MQCDVAAVRRREMFTSARVPCLGARRCHVAMLVARAARSVTRARGADCTPPSVLPSHRHSADTKQCLSRISPQTAAARATILKGADLETLSAKKVRQQLEQELGVDLSDRKKEIDAIIMADVEDQVNSHSEEEEVSEEETNKGKDESESEPEPDDKAGDDDDYEPGAKKPRKPKASPKKRRASDDDDSDEEWGKRKRSPAKKGGGGGGRGKKSAFTKSFKLSPELADVVGADVMPRHEVVKKLWAVIKERELQDPKNKQYAICDDQLLKVFGVKRFRTFGMMKHLKEHFLEAA
ncbi:upstream activation factor subunit spp27-like isoform X3 [Penaeus japonicus]|uniref:upstream activation factor subunit spp27-like isoform X3 n=1 Tax=Penaeus japonicus TaxID=27405 RepID=UPI001C71330A|nr:upstream activation factor subunit spp27-like isoform X3 [Penaeus japonicus]